MARPVAKSVADFEQEDKKIEEKKPRELVVEMRPDGLYEVRLEGGGRIPDFLQGRFTSSRIIHDLIKLHKEGR